jgi:hypothetical protein
MIDVGDAQAKHEPCRSRLAGDSAETDTPRCIDRQQAGSYKAKKMGACMGAHLVSQTNR